ncbi:type VII secretion integral membrane protein EccD [Streptomyces sp. NPDC060030]|uniref:type VII secretion integral membrane protein EccD n=1 Tax=Streptomyces sp. NPDC060030 TaxID=3347042 RepID=UPI0036CBA588
MSTTNGNVIAADLTRLVVHAPTGVIDIAVPSDVPMAELLPVLVSHAAPDEGDLDESGLEHGGWVLQRLGSSAFDEDSTAAELDLYDGESVYLRPRSEQLPPVHFDDLIDGVSTGMSERTDQWRPDFTRRLLLGVAAGALIAGLAVLVTLPGTGLRVGLSMGLGVALLLGSFAASRAMGDSVTGAALGLLAIPFFGHAGWLVPNGPPGTELTGARMLAAATASAGGAVLALSASAAAVALFSAAVLLCLVTAVTGVLALTAGLSPTQSAGSIAALTALFGTFIPVLSFRLSGLNLPPLPTNAEELQEGIDPLPARGVLARTAVADRYMTALYVASGLVCAASLTSLSRGSGWEPFAVGGVLSLMLILHSRGMASAWQRLAVALPGCYGALLLPVMASWHGSTLDRLAVLGLSAGLCAVMVLAAWHIPGRRLIPYWGRAADLLHSLTAIALIPLVLIDLGILPHLREMWS